MDFLVKITLNLGSADMSLIRFSIRFYLKIYTGYVSVLDYILFSLLNPGLTY